MLRFSRWLVPVVLLLGSVSPAASPSKKVDPKKVDVGKPSAQKVLESGLKPLPTLAPVATTPMPEAEPPPPPSPRSHP